MLAFIKRIIQHILEVHKWAWRVFFPLWASFTIASALTYAAQWCLLALILLLLAMICLIIAIATLIYHIRYARRSDKETKAEKDHKALVESFMRTGMSDKEAEIAARGH